MGNDEDEEVITVLWIDSGRQESSVKWESEACTRTHRRDQRYLWNPSLCIGEPSTVLITVLSNAVHFCKLQLRLPSTERQIFGKENGKPKPLHP